MKDDEVIEEALAGEPGRCILCLNYLDEFEVEHHICDDCAEQLEM